MMNRDFSQLKEIITKGIKNNEEIKKEIEKLFKEGTIKFDFNEEEETYYFK